jgi:hypothetical protein
MAWEASGNTGIDLAHSYNARGYCCVIVISGAQWLDFSLDEIAGLRQMEFTLDELLDHCRCSDDLQQCPISHSLHRNIDSLTEGVEQ